jgi:NADH dehydrogenase
LKDLDDAIALRQHILRLFERAAWHQDAATRDAMTTLVVVGGGPTGLETAGALHELYNHVLKEEYGDSQPRMRARVLLLEASDRLLSPYPEKLQQAAYRQLEDMGVEVILNAMVADATDHSITLKDGRVIATHTIVWAAGVSASPLAKLLDAELSRIGRIKVQPTMQIAPDSPIYAVGDIAHLEDEAGNPYPMVIPVAKQQGLLAADNILAEQKSQPKKSFVYSDRGIMATIGRSRAVAWIFYRVQLTGFLAWLSWLFLHLVVLLGFRNRLSVFLSWMWNYITYDRSVRLVDNQITEKEDINA